MSVKNYLDLTGLQHFKKLAIVNEVDSTGSGYIKCEDNEVAVSGITYYSKGPDGKFTIVSVSVGTSVSSYYKKVDPDKSAYSISATESYVDERILVDIGPEIEKRVSKVEYDEINKKLTYTNGGSHDVVTVDKIKQDMELPDVATDEEVQAIFSTLVELNPTGGVAIIPSNVVEEGEYISLTINQES